MAASAHKWTVSQASPRWALAPWQTEGGKTFVSLAIRSDGEWMLMQTIEVAATPDDPLAFPRAWKVGEEAVAAIIAKPGPARRVERRQNVPLTHDSHKQIELFA